MADGLKNSLDAMHSEIAAKALDCIHNRLPKKALSLNTIAKDDLFNRPLEEVEELTKKCIAQLITEEAKERSLDKLKVFPCGSYDDEENKRQKKLAKRAEEGEYVPLPSNTLITKCIEVLKRELIEMAEIVGTIKLWIQLNIPQIEDANNFGVGVQEDVVDELSRAEESAFSGLDVCSKYFLSRAEMIGLVKAYPFMSDYVSSLCEMDTKEYLSLRLSMTDMRNNYAILYDMVSKNLEKIERPKGVKNDVENIY